MLGILNAEQIEAILRYNTVGRIGCHSHDKVYIVPVTYIYDDNYIIGHSGEGLKIRMLRENPSCCFQVDHIFNMTNWQSIIAQGTFEELHGQEAELAMKKLVERLMPIVTSQSGLPAHAHNNHPQGSRIQNAIVYRIRLEEKTGRFEKQ